MMNIPIKRSREVDFNSLTSMANCLISLSGSTEFEPTSNRVFECKTCNRQFSSFQALGGHRASHKKPKLGADLSLQQSQLQASQAKPKTHECSICGVEFALGQALGGHMRRHRVAMNENAQPLPHHEPDSSVVDLVVKKFNSSRKVWCFDLNLTPMENGFELGLGKMAPAVDCFL